MNPLHPARAAICASLASIASLGWAASDTASTEAPRTVDVVVEKGEPAVKYTIIEDEGSRIDELRVRGQTQRITVTPKVGGKALAGRPYEIVSPAGSQDLQEAPNGVRGAAGKRVWHILSF